MNRKRWIRAFVLLSALCLFPARGALGAAAAQAERPAIDYNLVPNLEPMKDSAQTPDFTLGRLVQEKRPTASLWQRLRFWGQPAAAPPPSEKISLRDFRGKLVFLNFWASWCDPCREEMPAMERLYQEFKKRDFVILAVNVKDKRDAALAFMKELKLTYPAAFDPEGQVGLLYGAWGLPTTYLIGPHGEALARIWGPAKWYSPGARKLIKSLLDENAQ